VTFPIRFWANGDLFETLEHTDGTRLDDDAVDNIVRVRSMKGDCDRVDICVGDMPAVVAGLSANPYTCPTCSGTPANVGAGDIYYSFADQQGEIAYCSLSCLLIAEDPAGDRYNVTGEGK
jgi:hypothetical protein